jgi:hypothetical protein
MHGPLWMVRCILDAFNCCRLKCLVGIGKFFHALVVGIFYPR